MLIDTRIALETPEGIDLSLSVAGPVVRSYAWLVDFLIRLVAYSVLALALSGLGQFGFGLMMIAAFFLEWFYPVLFETLNDGATPGKRLFKLKVIHDDGSPVSWGASLLRNLLRAVDFLPMLYGLGLLSCLLHRDFKRLGDVAAGTLVIYRDPPLPIRALPEGEDEAPRQALKLHEQQAILAFAERAGQLSGPRQRELAELLSPELVSPAEPVAQLQRHARWLSGRQTEAAPPR